VARQRFFAVLALSAACRSASTPADATTSDTTPRAAQGAPTNNDPCAKLSDCPPHCPVSAESLASRGCGSEGLQCQDNATICRCEQGQWVCVPPEQQQGVLAQCLKKCPT
jgi:hypothetical protein